MLLTDTLSSAYMQDSTKDEAETEFEIVYNYLPISAGRLSIIRATMKVDT